MTFKELTDSVYIIPILLDHLKKPTALTAKMLKENGISESQVQEYRKVDKLLRYHLQTVQSWQPDYPLLREGLKQYFDKYLSRVFQMIGLVDKAWDVLDYGCGSGQLGKQFEKDNRQSKVTFLDRVDEVRVPDFWQVDFEKTPNWYSASLELFNCVLLSEVLHCKNNRGQQYLISSCHKILKPRGTLVVIENLDYVMAYRMNKLKKETKLNVVTYNDLMNLTIGKFRIRTKTSIVNHQIYVYEKI